MGWKKRVKIYGVVGMGLLLLLSVVRPYRVSDISMNYTLMDGDLVWVENLTIGVHVPSFFFFEDRHLWSREEGIRRGDLLVFRHPLDRRLYLKRCVALPGDRIFQKNKNLFLQLRGDSELTFIRGKQWGVETVRRRGGWWLKTPYAHFYAVVHDPSVVGPRELIDFPPITVPPHRYFMMGDYRDNSTDSRFFGPVPYDYIYYRVFAVWQTLRSLDALGSIRHYDETHPLVIREKY